MMVGQDSPVSWPATATVAHKSVHHQAAGETGAKPSASRI
jgi:hypothetical protein